MTPTPAAARVHDVATILFGLAVVASGVRQIVTSDYVRLVPDALRNSSWHVPGAHAVGVILIVLGGLIAIRRALVPAVVTLSAMVLLNLLLFHGPLIAASPMRGFVWTNPCKMLALIGGGVLIARRNLAAFESLRAPAFAAMALFLAVCGVQHFVYASFVDSLVPTWIPPAPRFWTYFTGSALVLGGVGILIPRTARVAASLSSAMIVLWILMLHIPRAVSTGLAFEWDGVFEATALSCVAAFIAAAAAERQVLEPVAPSQTEAANAT